ncbi:hypothetical protein INT47_003980 [Mucor saturninus]|uniref:ENTH domain-containing protein n=1 Tax=Mucor saturninus TaxID=64648 RepID=A0A8H7R8L4_9FUNG|nr:hypothetical protein INT47_003980 [Mucor saturninus]
MAGKGVVRSIKNIAKGFSDVQIKVREATSNDPWGPSGTLMNEIAQLTFNESDFIEIMDMIDKRLNDKGKNWRHVFKALLLLDYCLHVGSENVVLYAKENIYVVKTLKEFQHTEENGKDVGANVRQKAKDISNLLVDDNRLKEERRQRQGMRERMANVGDYLNESVRRINGESTAETAGARNWDDENELKKALAESKRIAALEEKNRRQGDDDLEKALQISQQEALEQEKKKKEALEKENTNNLFNGSFGAFPQQQVFNSPANNPYQQQQQQQQQPVLQLEWTQPNAFDTMQNNPYQQQQQQQQAQNPYLQHQFNANGLQAQMTGFVSPSPQQPTMDFFSPQSQGLQAQMTGFPSSPQPLFGQQSPLPPQQQQQSFQSQGFAQPSFQTSMVTGTNPFSQMSSHGQSPALQPQQQQQQQHDYSGLVFGGHTTSSPQQQYASATTPNFGFSTATSSTPNFSFQTPATGGGAAVSSPSPAFANTTTSINNNSAFSSPQPTPSDLKFAKLNALLANKDDGMDTFGNQGNLRIPYGTGFASSSGFKPVEDNMTKNPFGQINQNQSPKPSKSLLDLMQEQKQQQHFNSSFF